MLLSCFLRSRRYRFLTGLLSCFLICKRSCNFLLALMLFYLLVLLFSSTLANLYDCFLAFLLAWIFILACLISHIFAFKSFATCLFVLFLSYILVSSYFVFFLSCLLSCKHSCSPLAYNYALLIARLLHVDCLLPSCLSYRHCTNGMLGSLLS